MATKVRVDNVYKVFGPSPDKALAMLDEEMSKDDILNDSGNVVAVADVSFAVEEGTTFMVMGLSGSGKSTLIRCINGLISPTKGRISVDEEDITEASEDQLRDLRRHKMSMVFQHFALFPHKTVLDNVEYGLKVQAIPSSERRARAMEALELVGLQDWGGYFPENLSGGMQQRVGLARAMAINPEILLMDEAFSALDPLIRREMQDELIELQRRVHRTIVFITHDLTEALKLGDQVAVLKDGRIVQVGSPEEIVSSPADEYVAAFTQDVDRGRVLTVGSITKAPNTILNHGQCSVQHAVSFMDGSDVDVLHLVDLDSKPLGLVVREDIVRASQEGVDDLGLIARDDFPVAAASDTLADTYDVCTSGLPVAVVDDDGRLAGVVHPLDLLANLSPGQVDEQSNEQPEDAPDQLLASQ